MTFEINFNGEKVAEKEDDLSVRLKINDLLKRRDMHSIEIISKEVVSSV